ncbi:hypothetical protein V1639_00095 [Pseudarthrobacter sp. J75]|uniref:AMIN-like domain-containing (lipo)protein n=1 Tax=unclassified Pseudarthrobacter TaxID=2647000 RepID=UPI002E80E2DB|nr:MULTISPECIES: hypothetical protein [unclassified Pseudarthrobacter]MEE2523172.1 hypothetical protein [Pseudarthrobacter sp. J47]MEE2527427.1 hypothetical protein [Pseudarthrobacter sp. J75]MEE2569876.1 hypothetical protein [Pseudarthrobacter sp. J64]
MKKILTLLTALLMAVGLGLVVPGPASATGSYCGLVWGSTAERNAAMSTASVTNVRTGQHYCFDRLVVDLNGPAAGYYVRYVSAVTEDGSGFSVPLRGGAFIQVTVNAPSYDASGNSTYTPANKRELQNVSGYQTFRQVASAGSFEGYTNIGLGVRARLPFRVFTLDGPGSGSRLVVDVAHFW